MSRRAWSGDLHLGHDNINQYCGRPFDSAEDAVLKLSREFNMRLSEDDTLVHVGDYINYGTARGVPGLRIKPEEYMRLFKGKWVFIEGNHDHNNKLKTVGRYLFSKISHFNVFVTHYPTVLNGGDPQPKIPEAILKSLKGTVDFVICGHVHEKWKYLWDPHLELFNINVGVDQWKYRPVFDDELSSYYIKLLRGEVE